MQAEAVGVCGLSYINYNAWFVATICRVTMARQELIQNNTSSCMFRNGQSTAVHPRQQKGKEVKRETAIAGTPLPHFGPYKEKRAELMAVFHQEDDLLDASKVQVRLDTGRFSNNCTVVIRVSAEFGVFYLWGYLAQ